ncbi:FxsA family protein [Pseudosulfitobacter koreensis]|uniref:FxsA family protein n=1 Tax=Pseudosulfitobacter koreensis TaxID=2968472 RepID=A0ABT1YX64_9RHOB|nr:FxsA family protein [Pseudosulfitobacter koreense]MCR8825462.1 FxsA family protein [Pseudosulfitobacter koreense]
MWLFLAFLVVPLIEITLFIQIGGAIGLGWTLLTVIVTAIVGTYLVRQQGLRTIDKLRSSVNELHDPTEPLVHGAMILFAGALLLTPGFFTDAVGFSLMIPQVRSRMFQALRSRINVASFATGPQNPPRRPGRPDVIDADYHDVTPDDKKPQGPSGWTKN